MAVQATNIYTQVPSQFSFKAAEKPEAKEEVKQPMSTGKKVGIAVASACITAAAVAGIVYTVSHAKVNKVAKQVVEEAKNFLQKQDLPAKKKAILDKTVEILDKPKVSLKDKKTAIEIGRKYLKTVEAFYQKPAKVDVQTYKLQTISDKITKGIKHYTEATGAKKEAIGKSVKSLISDQIKLNGGSNTAEEINKAFNSLTAAVKA